MSFVFYCALVVFISIAALLCFVILIQESKSMGMGASFGGEAGESLFGTSTAGILKKFTAWLAIVFMVSCVLLSMWTQSIGRTQSNSEVIIERTESH